MQATVAAWNGWSAYLLGFENELQELSKVLHLAQEERRAPSKFSSASDPPTNPHRLPPRCKSLKLRLCADFDSFLAPANPLASSGSESGGVDSTLGAIHVQR